MPMMYDQDARAKAVRWSLTTLPTIRGVCGDQRGARPVGDDRGEYRVTAHLQVAMSPR
jgi:hypothetical protein